MEYNPMNVFYSYAVSSTFQVYLHWFWDHLYKWREENEIKRIISLRDK